MDSKLLLHNPERGRKPISPILYSNSSSNYYYITLKGDGNYQFAVVDALLDTVNYYYITPKGDGNTIPSQLFKSIIQKLLLHNPERGRKQRYSKQRLAN